MNKFDISLEEIIEQKLIWQDEKTLNWCKNCPHCNEIQQYKYKDSCFDAHRKNVGCRKCKNKRQRISENTKLIELGKIWQENESWCRNCPICDKIIKHTGEHSKHNALSSHKNKKTCFSCQNEYTRNFHRGKSRPQYVKDKISIANKGKIKSQEHCDNISKSKTGKTHKGAPHSLETRQKMSRDRKGRILSEEHKGKIRAANLRKMKNTGIPPNQDVGCPEILNKFNKFGFEFKPTEFSNDLGYVADGYCEKSHVWFEYDSPYHDLKYQTDKDLIRQNNIIWYFISIGKPLNAFIRYHHTGTMKAVFRKRWLENGYFRHEKGNSAENAISV